VRAEFLFRFLSGWLAINSSAELIGNTAPRHEPTVQLSVDQNNIIVRVNNAWDDFATQNNGAHLANESVLGLNLIEAITGKVTRNFNLALLELARTREQTIYFDYRCDSPHERRFMRAHLNADRSGAVHFSHEHLYSEKFPHLVMFNSATQRGRDSLIRCSLCNHVRHKGLWASPDFISHTLFFDTPVPVTYGVCPSCQELLNEF
jgi:hypothetical protein